MMSLLSFRRVRSALFVNICPPVFSMLQWEEWPGILTAAHGEGHPPYVAKQPFKCITPYGIRQMPFLISVMRLGERMRLFGEAYISTPQELPCCTVHVQQGRLFDLARQWLVVSDRGLRLLDRCLKPQGG